MLISYSPTEFGRAPFRSWEFCIDSSLLPTLCLIMTSRWLTLLTCYLRHKDNGLLIILSSG